MIGTKPETAEPYAGLEIHPCGSCWAGTTVTVNGPEEPLAPDASLALSAIS